jgi:hypothetical protein
MRAVVLAAGVLAGCAVRPPTVVDPAQARYVRFADRDWVVRPTGTNEAPGGNDWSDDARSVWVDDEGLHLVVRRQGGRWWAAEVHTDLPEGPVHIEAEVATPMAELDPQVVAGIFVYRDDDHEVDIELSQFGGGNGFNAQYAVAPYGPGDRHRFVIPQHQGGVRHVLDWRLNRAALDSRGPDRSYAEWRWTGEKLQDRSGYRLHINLWLYEAKPPQGKQPV